MRTLHKYCGAGNTFLIVDDREQSLSTPSIHRLCQTACKLAADGVILWRTSSTSDAEMVYFNRDGSSARMCGNGLRCFVHFLHQQGLSSVHRIEVGGQLFWVSGDPPAIRTWLGPARVLEWGITLFDRTVYVVDTGVPHAVIFALLDPLDVIQRGREMRYHRRFAPLGVNVNFVWIDSPDRIRVRTYERGVETETPACGTGAAACAFVAQHLGHIGHCVQVTTRSGATLAIDLTEGCTVGGPSEKLGVWQLSC